ncbi:Uncharacterised protein [Vibrio cholerae]|nr:Uncharacterised protein [Vibrio cholerae]
MRQSIYLQLAVLLVRAELRREERVWKRKVRRSRDAVVAERRVRHIRRVLAARIPT